MRRTWVHEFSQQGDYRKFRDREGQDTGAERCNGVLDDILLLLDVQRVEMPPAT